MRAVPRAERMTPLASLLLDAIGQSLRGKEEAIELALIALFAGGHVLIGGRRRPIVGVVTMDQLMVDMGDDPVEVGDEVVLIGRQGDEAVTAADWARLLGTIGYEIVCAISARIARHHGPGT